LTGIIVYANTFQVPFLLDDERSITQNDVIKSLANFYANSSGYDFVPNRFVCYLTFALNYHFGGLNITGFHVTNLLIHLIASLLVYALLRLTFRTPYFLGETEGSGSGSPGLADPLPSAFSLQPSAFIPLFAALLFVVHPIQTQAVTYVVQRMTALATMFYLLSVMLYVKARLRIELKVRCQRSGEKIHNTTEEKHSSLFTPDFSLFFYYAGSVLAAVLAMKTKEIAFTLPFAIVLYEAFFFRGDWKKRLLYLLPLLATLPIIPLAIIEIGGPAGDILADTGEQLRVGHGISRLEYLLTQFRVIVTYLRLLILPINQNLDYDYPVYTTFFSPQVFLSFLLLTAIVTLAVYLFIASRPNPQKSHKVAKPGLRLIAFGIFWFFLTVSVESSLIPIRDVIMEHRLYLPGFGAAAAFAVAFFLLVDKLARPSNGKLLLVSAASLLLVLGFATYQRNHVWGDAIRLWQDVAIKSPNKGRPLNNLGVALEDAGRRPEAFKAMSKAIEVDPNYYKSYYNLADLYLVSDQPGTALQLLQTAIRLNPNFTEAYVSVGAALMRAGKFREVTIFLEQNLDRIADNAEARFYLGASYAFLGNRERAMRELAILSKLDASYAANLAGMMGLKSKHGLPNGRQ
jgi:Flp pilus assembly protein TadD